MKAMATMRRISVIKILAVSIASFQQTYISPTGKIKCRIVRQRGSRGAHSIVSIAGGERAQDSGHL